MPTMTGQEAAAASLDKARRVALTISDIALAVTYANDVLNTLMQELQDRYDLDVRPPHAPK